MKKILLLFIIFFFTFSVSSAENTEREIDDTICNGTEKIWVRYYGVDKDIWQIFLSFSDWYTENKELALKHWFQDYPEIIDFIQKLDKKWLFPCEEISEFYISDIELSADKKHYIIWYYYTNKIDNKKYSVILKDDKIVKSYPISSIEIYAKDYVTQEVFKKYYEEGEKRSYQESSFVRLSRYNDDYMFFNWYFSELR